MCACKSNHRYDCWALRYQLPADDEQAIDADGGPCTCSCHDEFEEIIDDFKETYAINR